MDGTSCKSARQGSTKCYGKERKAPKATWLKTIEADLNTNLTTASDIADDKVAWRSLVHN